MQLAEEYDKNGERTLSVITKPDLVLEPGAQAAVCDLIQDKRQPLTLGYFLVRNRGANGDSVAELDHIFRLQPLNGLPEDRVGILALKDQTGTLLVEISRREFPKLLQDASNEVRENRVVQSRTATSR